MFTRPADLSDADVRAALVSGWGLDVVAVEHARVGFGSHHWWVTTADGGRWFATADDLRTRRVAADEPLAGPLARLRAALTTAATLREHGLDWVVAPRRADDERVVVPVGEAFALSVYPRVDGRAFGWGPYEDPHHRAAVLDHLVVLHATTGCRGAAGTDDLGRALVAGLRALIDDPGPSGTTARSPARRGGSSSTAARRSVPCSTGTRDWSVVRTRPGSSSPTASRTGATP